METMTPGLPVGYHRFARSRFVNYQLNRWYSLGFTRFEDVAEAGRQIRSFDDNTRIFMALASAAEADGRLRNAAFYHRAAEFLVDPADPSNRNALRLSNAHPGRRAPRVLGPARARSPQAPCSWRRVRFRAWPQSGGN